MDTVKIVKYLTRNIPNAEGGYILQDDANGSDVYIAEWFEPLLGTKPTLLELQNSESDALLWYNTLELPEIPAGVFYSYLPLDKQTALSAMAPNDPIINMFLNYLTMNGATVTPGGTKTNAAVFYLSGTSIDGNTISTPILTPQEAQDWLDAFV